MRNSEYKEPKVQRLTYQLDGRMSEALNKEPEADHISTLPYPQGPPAACHMPLLTLSLQLRDEDQFLAGADPYTKLLMPVILRVLALGFTGTQACP